MVENSLFPGVLMWVTAHVGDEEILIQQHVSAEVFDRPDMRAHVEQQLRHELVSKILEHWKPVIHIER